MIGQWQYTTIETVKQAYSEKSGGYFFSPGALRGFRSRFSGDAYHNPTTDEYLFISSEQFVSSRGEAWPRQYTIRRFYRTEEGHWTIREIGKFQKFASLSGAKAAMQRYMKENPSGTPTAE